MSGNNSISSGYTTTMSGTVRNRPIDFNNMMNSRGRYDTGSIGSGNNCSGNNGIGNNGSSSRNSISKIGKKNKNDYNK
jgi:hypothetical protein